MAGKETLYAKPGEKGLTDKGLDTWQTWNKMTLTAEGVAIAGGLMFGVPWLVALGTTGAVIDGIQMVAIDDIKKRRAQSRYGEKMQLRDGKILESKDPNDKMRLPASKDIYVRAGKVGLKVP